MRTFLAILLCKLIRLILRALRRGGTSLPGRAAMRVCPDLLRRVSRGVTTVIITGTNGKTTSARIVETALAAAGASYFSNRSGANLIWGITTEFALNATLTGRSRKKYAVIECDEAASIKVCEYIDPAVVLVTNVFRDQLDRYGEVSHTLEGIKNGVANSPNAILCLNADCSLTASIDDGSIDNEIVYYGVDVPVSRDDTRELSDAPYCIRCKTKLEYDYITYAHLGGFRCPGCGYSRPRAGVAVTGIVAQGPDTTEALLEINGERVAATINLPGAYNIYNAAGAAAAVTALGFPPELALEAITTFECGFGRMEKFEIEGQPVRMILVKNPAGCNQALSYLASCDGEVLFAACLSDKIADGTDVSWVWDARFEKLTEMESRLAGVLVSGSRADDMALRLKYAGLPMEKVRVIRDYDELLSAMVEAQMPVVVMPTYTAMLELRDKISAKYGYKDFWE